MKNQVTHWLALGLLLGSEGPRILAAKDSEEKKCKALSMRAGGVKGMYQVGILQSLYEHLPHSELAYDVTTGASIGAVNAATLGMFAKGNETEAYKILYDDWADLSTD